MSMGHGARGGRISSADTATQKELNEEAPKIANLSKRIIELFAPYRGALMLIAASVVLSAGLGILPPLITQRVFDDALFPPGQTPNLSLLCFLVSLMIAIFLFSGALGIGQTFLTARVGNSVMGDLRVKLFAHLQSMELAFFTRTKTGVIQSRLQNDVGGVANVLTNTVSSVVGNTVTVIAAFIAMLLLSPPLTLIAVIVMPFLVIAQRRVGQVRARIAGKTQESLSQMSAITQESLSISGVLLAKTFSRQSAETLRYETENKNQIRLQIRQAMSGQVFFALVQVFMSAVPAIVYLVAGWLISNSTGSGGLPEITAGTIVAFTTVQSRLLFPLMGLMRVALDIQTSRALFARIFEYLDLRPEIVDSPEARRASTVQAGEKIIEFDEVSFSYSDQGPDEEPTLKNVSFEIRHGEFVAFVGASGSGKTTIGSLIPRLFEATTGTVRFAGDDVKELQQQSLMDEIGMVTQDSYLFHASIAENLRYAKAGASDEEIKTAARQANIHETILSFPNGYDTIVGERGQRLSGGEKQRIAIARVLLKNPPVLILDEATSALDTVSEQIVQRALDEARSGRTTVAIAHRLSTIVAADRIYVVEKGKIIEHGTHDELYARGGKYTALMNQQRSH